MFLAKHFLGTATDEADDIRRNLQLVLSTKRGSGYPLRNLGLSDCVFRTPEEMVTVLSQELKENIRLYEPRVELVKIDEVYDDGGQRVSLVVVLKRRTTKDLLRLNIDLKTGQPSLV